MVTVIRQKIICYVRKNGWYNIAVNENTEILDRVVCVLLYQRIHDSRKPDISTRLTGGIIWSIGNIKMYMW